MKKIKNISKSLTKRELLSHISLKTGLTKNNINNVFNELLCIIKDHMINDGPEKFTLPGFFKLSIKKIPAQEEKIGVNPFTKEEMLFKAKPASKKLKIKILKNLRDSIK
jgi:nucleoid DNA-binding protein